MTTERESATTAGQCRQSDKLISRPPRECSALPAFDRGWVVPGSLPAPFLTYVEADPSVNWSDELEELHEEASRTHFLDRWTRGAIIGRMGQMRSRPTIADIGCSTGYLLEDVRTAHPSATLVGVDLIAAGLEKAHRLVPSARLLRADACDLPLLDATVDVVVSANLLEHIPDDRGALREFARVLAPGGRAVIVVPAGPTTYDYYDRFLGHERRYARHELASKCRDAGLQVLEDAHLGSLLYPAFWLVKQRNRRVGGALTGGALQRQVTADIARTHDSSAGGLVWALERRLTDRGLCFPFGIRSLVVARRDAETS